MRLLCADDDQDIRTIIRLALGVDPTIHAQVCNSGAELLSVVRTVDPDAVLLDVQMPAPDGFTTCAALKADPATAHIPVIFLTALASETVLERIRTSGAVGYLQKPFDPMTLANSVRTQLRDSGSADAM